MKKSIIILAFMAMGLFTKPVFAQFNDAYFNMYYSMGLGVGDMKDYVSKYSWRGVGMEYKSEVTDNLMVGFGADWNVFYENMDYGTYTRDNVSISGKQYRYLNAFPMAAKFTYFRDSDMGLRVMAGTGVGTTYMMEDLDMGSYRLNVNTWQFLVAPELGVAYDLDATRSLLLSVKYNYNFKNTELDSRSYLSFNVGFAFNQ